MKLYFQKILVLLVYGIFLPKQYTKQFYSTENIINTKGSASVMTMTNSLVRKGSKMYQFQLYFKCSRFLKDFITSK